MISLFVTFFMIGLTTFGGGYAMIGRIREKVVEQKKWMTNEELTWMIGVAEATPGPIAINLATYVGYRKNGVKGSIIATLGVVLPSVIIMYIISLLLRDHTELMPVRYCFMGIKSGVAFLILKTGFEMAKKQLIGIVEKTLFAVVLMLWVAIDIFSINIGSYLLIVLGGAVGLIHSIITVKRESTK